VVPVAPSPFEWRPEYLLWILAAGATLRFAWIAAGLIRLRHYRRDARRVDSPIPFEGANVRWYVSDRIAGPVTFGWIKPTDSSADPLPRIRRRSARGDRIARADSTCCVTTGCT
jgi:hypothetical protein